jgi:hypothetical protein
MYLHMMSLNKIEILLKLRFLHRHYSAIHDKDKMIQQVNWLMSGCPLSDVAMSSPSLDCILNAGQVEPPTPTDSTSSKAPLDGDRIPYDELLSKYVDLQSSNTSLQSNVERLELQNNYWTKLYTYVEQGLTLKIAELNTLREENQQLKVSRPSKECSDYRKEISTLQISWKKPSLSVRTLRYLQM